MQIDGIKKTSDKSVFKNKANGVGAFLLPDELNIESPQPDIIIVGKKKQVKTQSSFSSPVGLRKVRSKNKKNKKLLFRSIILLILILFASLLIYKAYESKRELDLHSKNAQNHLEAAASFIEEGDLSSSIKEANEAKNEIEKMKLLAQSWGQDMRFLRLISSNSKLVANEQLLDATFLIVKTLNDINDQLSTLGSGDGLDQDIPGESFVYNLAQSKTVLSAFADTGINNLEVSKRNLLLAMPHLSDSYKNRSENAIKTIDKTIISLSSIKTITSEDLPWLSGMDGTPKNIMVLLQNNAELRGGSGGSLGSFGIARFADGKLKSIDFAKNIYKIDQAFEQKGEFVEVPTELKWLRCRGGCTWTLKDSGWSVDGAEASKKIIWFYEKETGQNIDGVIMIDTTAIVALLKELGPINMPAYQKTITSDNFRDEVEYEVHKGYFDREGGKEENEPKKILSDMMPIFLDRTFSSLKDKDKALKIFGVLSETLKKKDMTLYFEKIDFQQRINNLNYSGGVLPATGDYLYVNNSNIGGEKSSLNIEQNIEIKVNIIKSASTKNSLILKRKHTGSGSWPDGINKNFVRMLLPERSEIVNFEPVSGSFEQYYDNGAIKNNYYTSAEHGKHNVNYWMSTKPGEVSQLKVDYDTGYVPCNGEKEFTYILNLQKQPGANDDKIRLSISIPEEYKPLNVKNYQEGLDIINLKFNLDADRLIKIRFVKKE